MISQNTIDYLFIPFLVHFLSYWTFGLFFFLIDLFYLHPGVVRQSSTANPHPAMLDDLARSDEKDLPLRVVRQSSTANPHPAMLDDLARSDEKDLPENHQIWTRYKLAATTSLKNQLYISLPTLYIVNSSLQSIIEASRDDSIIYSIWKIFLIINLSNLCFYWSHRLLHVSFIFKHVHSKHHEFIEPIGVAALYAHPIEHLISNTLCFLVPFLYIGCNYSITLVILSLSSIIPVLYHTKSLNFFNDHLVHHRLFKYNFGFGGYLDKLFGTYFNKL